MSNKAKKEPFWMSPTLNWIISLGIAVCCGWLGNYLYYDVIISREEPVKPKGKSDWVLVDIEDALPEGAVYEGGADKILVPPDVDPRVYFESLPDTEDEEEPEEEVDPAEAERLANWKANFPYKPTTDPDVVITEEMLEEGYGYTPIFRNHGYMRHFFENETRFTAQFEQLYHILEEHGRGDNPMATGNIFEDLRLYQENQQKPPNERNGMYDHIEERHLTNAEAAEEDKEAILGTLMSERMWPVLGGMPEEKAVALRDRILSEIQGVDKLPPSGMTTPDATKYVFVINGDYGDELEPGDSPLVIRPGWQAAYEEKYPSGEAAIKRMLGVDENNVLLDNGQPIEYREGENIAALITPDGIEVPLILDDNGNVIIPTPSEIEEMINNGEGKYVEIPDENANQPPRYITEEEWKIQEALRQVEEAAR